MSKGGLPAVAAIAVPLLALRIDALTAAALLLPIYLVSDAIGLWLYRHNFSPRNLAILIPTGLVGVFIGYLLAPLISVPMLEICVAAIGLWYCFKAWFGSELRRKLPADLPRGIFWGIITGLTSFVSHAGAPPYQMYVLPQKLPKLVFAGTSTITFAAINLAKLPPYLALNQFPNFQTGPIIILLISSIAGAFAGARLTRLISDDIFYKIIRLALFAISLRLIWKAVQDLI